MQKIFDTVRDIPGVRQLCGRAVSIFRHLVPGPRRVPASERQLLATLQRDGIRRELANRAAASRAHEEGQRYAFNRLWRAVRSPEDELTPPAVLRAQSPSDVDLALAVVGDFDAAREAPGPFAECLYRPAADLPYPEHDIRRCCEFLIGIADSPPESFPGNHEVLVRERDALGIALFSLDYFLSLPAGEIPRQKMQNLAFARRHHGAGPAPFAKPRPGQCIDRGSRGTDRVDQLLGIAENEEWMVLTESGAAVRVRSGPTLKIWTEVQEVAPVTADWLNLTPPSGIPTLQP